MLTNQRARLAGVMVYSVLAATTWGENAPAASAPAPSTPQPSVGDEVLSLVTPQPANPKRAYQALREDEDWRWLGAGAKDHDLFDPIKFIPVGSDLSLSFGGSARLRYEYKINPGFGATNAKSPTKNDDYFLERAYFHTDIRYKDYVRVFVEGIWASIDGNRRNPPPTPFPDDAGDLHQAFVDISPLSLKDGLGVTVRLGRQELLFDKQKLVGPLDWANTRRTFDGGAALFAFEQYKAELFWVRPVQVNPQSFDTTDEQTNFAGAYLTHPMYGIKDNFYSLFCYYLNRTRDTKSSFVALETEFNPDGQSGNTDRVTLGARGWGKFLTNFDYDIEGGVQVGRLAQNDIFAGYVSAELGYTFSEIYAQPRISLGYDYASGDDGRGNCQSNTFDQLFPTGHLYLGYLDLVGRQNIDAGNITISTTPLRDLKVWTSWHYFCLASANDALYNASAQAVRFSPTGSAGTNVGNEWDLTGSYQLGRHTTLLVGYGVFFPGDFIRNTGKYETAQMVYSSIEFKF